MEKIDFAILLEEFDKALINGMDNMDYQKADFRYFFNKILNKLKTHSLIINGCQISYLLTEIDEQYCEEKITKILEHKKEKIILGEFSVSVEEIIDCVIFYIEKINKKIKENNMRLKEFYSMINQVEPELITKISITNLRKLEYENK